MARPAKNTEEIKAEVTKPVSEKTNTEPIAEKDSKTQEEIPSRVLQLMKLNPQYEEIWVTPSGFVHPKNAPKYCTKGATLYKNKYFKK